MGDVGVASDVEGHSPEPVVARANDERFVLFDHGTGWQGGVTLDLGRGGLGGFSGGGGVQRRAGTPGKRQDQGEAD